MTQVDMEMLKRIDELGMSERVVRLRKLYFDSKVGLASERMTAIMEVYDEVKDEPLEIQRAKMLERIVERVPCVIWQDQRLVGGCKYYRGAYPHCDYDGTYLQTLLEEYKKEGGITFGGPVETGFISKEDLPRILEAADFWQGRSVVDKLRGQTREFIGDWFDNLVEAGTYRYDSGPQCFHVPQYDKLLRLGYSGIIKEAEDRIQSWLDNQESEIGKLHFWQAVVIACKAAIRLGKRYSQRARQMADAELDPERRAALLRVAETCEWVPGNPARTFQEALQSMIISHQATYLSSPLWIPPGWGRVDDFLYPYFKRDLEEGRLTLQEAVDLVCEFMVYMIRLERMVEISTRDYSQKGDSGNVSLGGPDKDGNDMSNELSYLFLHARGLTAFPEPHVSIRWHKGLDGNGTPHWLMAKALETNCKVGGGVPQFQNSDHIVKYFTDRGVALEPARLWAGHGCSQATPDDQRFSTLPVYLNLALGVDLALHNGIASKPGKRLTPPIKDPRECKTFNEFYDLFCKHTEHMMRRQLWYDNLKQTCDSMYWPMPLHSALGPGCVEKGRDFQRGGLNHYRICYKIDRGIVPAADSFTAIKKLIYDEKRLTMDELIEALDSNFAGERGEKIRQLCLSAPKYGNEDAEADQMVCLVGKFSAGVIQSVKNIFGYPYAINRNGQAWHFSVGKKLAALPTGRKAGTPLPDGSLSPMHGMDKKGPTAVLNSALAADFKEALGGVMTMQFPGSLAASPQNRDKLITLVESFFERGGTYLQFNLVNAEALKDAKLHPENYRDLVVRVGGYSAFFVMLSPEIQDEIIARTQHTI